MIVLAASLFTATSCSTYMDVAPQPTADKINSDKILTGKELTPASITKGATPTQADLEALGNLLAARLMNTTGYAATISYNGALKTSRNAGSARLSPDTPTRTMDIFSRYSVASVAKTISAAALMKAISVKAQGSALLNEPAYKYLPKHWTYASSSKQITLMQLLRHTAGIRSTGGSDYALLKQLMANGVLSTNVNVYQYDNANYGFMRLIIPTMAGYTIDQISSTSGMTTAQIDKLESAQATVYADSYKDYCRKSIFEKLGSCTSQVIDCKNTYDDYPNLYYRFQSGVKGSAVGDLTLVSASQGWVLNTFQVDEFFRKLAFTNTLIPQSYHTIMVNNTAGYDVTSQTNDGISYYWKNGIYETNLSNPSLSNSYRSVIIGFGDGIQITIMANSAINLQNTAILAHQDWVK
jgi:hypothetical protein